MGHLYHGELLVITRLGKSKKLYGWKDAPSARQALFRHGEGEGTTPATMEISWANHLDIRVDRHTFKDRFEQSFCSKIRLKLARPTFQL